MMSNFSVYKNNAIELRKLGKSYGEIRKTLGILIPKSTLSYWCAKIPLPPNYQERINKLVLVNGDKGRRIALEVNKIKREEYLKGIFLNNKYLVKKVKDKDIAKIVLSMLFICEGSKTSGSVCFGNSSPGIVKLFLKLLRLCYKIDENKFSCKVQCRADQDTIGLEKFWSKVTNIPLAKFKKAFIDSRTIGKPSIKKNYKGVLRIDYFSAHIYNELTIIGNMFCN